MVVKIKKKTQVMGEEIEATQYLPEDLPLTRERREGADLLDEELQTVVDRINKDYAQLDDSVKKDELKKWKWLGSEIDAAFKSVKNIDRSDMDKHVIWPALGQYFREELRRGFDAKRSGTKKDHYRKCWLIATLPDTDWFNSWSGWDAFIDRGEQLVMSRKVIHALKNKLSSANLGPRDYQKIAKMITERLPSGTSEPIDLGAMSDEETEKVVESVIRDFKKAK